MKAHKVNENQILKTVDKTQFNMLSANEDVPFYLE
jgi:hypothetical protein